MTHHGALGQHAAEAGTTTPDWLHGQGDPVDEYAPLTVVVVDREGTLTTAVERAVRSLPRVLKLLVVSQPTKLMAELDGQWPDLLLAGPDEMTPTGLRRLTQLHRVAPGTVIALTQPVSAQRVSMADITACRPSEVIAHPLSTVKVRNALQRLIAAAETMRAERTVVREVQVPVPSLVPVHQAKIYTVTSPTGGCGKTFFATNLAAYLARGTGRRVLLIDLDLQFGEVSLALGMRPERTIAELVNEESLEDAFAEYVVDHSAGYKVLSAPADPFAAELVGPREATRVLDAAKGLYDYIVIDTPPSLNEVVLAAFDQSRYLVVMATMDVPSLRNLRVFLETIDRLKLPAENVSCLLNKAEPDNGIDLNELLRVYPGGFAAVLPYAREVARSLNVGQPVLASDPRSEISHKLLEACAALIPAADITRPYHGDGPKRGRKARRKERHAPVAVPMPSLVPQGVAQPPPVQHPVPEPAPVMVEVPGPVDQAPPPPRPGWFARRRDRSRAKGRRPRHTAPAR